MGITVITGGQTGVDTVALDAARTRGEKFAEWEALLPKDYRR
jgi:hypothetical protein